MTILKGDNSFVSPIALMKGERLKCHLFKTLLAHLILVLYTHPLRQHYIFIRNLPPFIHLIIKSQPELKNQQQQQQQKPP